MEPELYIASYDYRTCAARASRSGRSGPFRPVDITLTAVVGSEAEWELSRLRGHFEEKYYPDLDAAGKHANL